MSSPSNSIGQMTCFSFLFHCGLGPERWTGPVSCEHFLHNVDKVRPRVMAGEAGRSRKESGDQSHSAQRSLEKPPPPMMTLSNREIGFRHRCTSVFIAWCSVQCCSLSFALQKTPCRSLARYDWAESASRTSVT